MSVPREEPSSRPASRARTLTTAALLASLLAASALPALRVGPVPVTLQVLVVVLAALLLPPAGAALCVAVYLAAGAAGLPVFSGMTGGLASLAGPTGGYLWGFLAGAVLGSLARRRLERAALRAPWPDVAAAAIVIVAVYALGVTQLAFVAHLTPGAALASGALPFILPDVVKAAVAIGLAAALRRVRPGR